MITSPYMSSDGDGDGDGDGLHGGDLKFTMYV